MALPRDKPKNLFGQHYRFEPSLPVIALVGRPNVGKSTLFNVLTGTRDALVADLPGLTRDRQYGYGRRGGHYIVVDTGGLVAAAAGVEALMAAQTERAVAEADHVLLIVDAREGPTPADRHVAERLRRAGKPVTVVANKSEGLDPDVAGCMEDRRPHGATSMCTLMLPDSGVAALSACAASSSG